MNNTGRFQKALYTVMAALVCILIGLLIGFIILVVLSWSAYAAKGMPFSFGDVISQAWNKGFYRIFQGGFYLLNWERDRSLGRIRGEIAQAAPLLMCGLSVGFAFKTGLFNIGAAGQYTVGAFGGLLFAIVLKCPWWLCLFASAVFGAVWGAIPGFFKAYFNINEVITSIMFNWIGLYGVNTLFYANGKGIMYNAHTTKTVEIKSVNASGVIPDLTSLGSKLFKNPATISVFIAIAIAILFYVILNKTVFGYELKACGYSKTAAKYAGINEKRNIIFSMAIAGALAGMGAGLYYLTDTLQWNPLTSTSLPATGFDGIAVALLASSNPIGIIFSAAFKAHLAVGGGNMVADLFPKEIADIMSGVIIYLCAFMMLFSGKIAALFARKSRRKELNK